jgi:pyrimidine deaminase RibD-like protein
MILNGQERDSDYYGMVAACVVGPGGERVYGINYATEDGTRVHAERAAIDAYGEITTECMIVTTLSPCNRPMDERSGESCEALIKDLGITHVYCGYKDPTQKHDSSVETNNTKLRELCKKLADTFLKENLHDGKKLDVTEAFDQPYAVQWTKTNGDWHATADLDDGSELVVLFMSQGDNQWMVEFERDENMEITGEGDAPRVFATVLTAMRQFIAKRKPAMLNFSAEKEDDPTGSRARLYDRMVQRYITGTGYDLARQDYPGGATYTLTQIQKSVKQPKQEPAVAEDQINELGNAPAEYTANRKRKNSLFHATVDNQWVDVFFDRSEFNDTLHITFTVNGNYDTPSRPTSASKSTVKILSTVLNVIKQRLPEYIKKSRPPGISFTAKEDNRAGLYRKYFVPVIQDILGAKWAHEEYPSMGMTVFHWRPVRKTMGEELNEISDRLLQNYLSRSDRQISRRLDRMSQARERLNKGWEIYDANKPTRIIDRFEANSPQEAQQYYQHYIDNYNPGDQNFEFYLRRSTGIIEAFDQPYPSKWEKSDYGDYDALAKLPDGTNLSIMFNHEGDDEWQVEFYRNNSQEVTGEGDAQRVFATVLNSIQQFIEKQHPGRIRFSATKDDDGNNQSRAKLYDRLVRRYANSWGYSVEISDHAGSTVYELFNDLNEVTMVPTVAKSKREHLDVMPNDGQPIPKGQEADYLGDLVADMGRGLELWSWTNRGTVTYYVFDTSTRTSQLGTTGRPYTTNRNSFVIQGVYSGPKNTYRAADLYAFLILNQGLTLVSDNKQSEGGYRVWQELEKRYKNINVHGFDTRTDQGVNVTTKDEPDTHVDRTTVKSAGPQMKKELGTISRDLRFVASAR